MHLSHKYPAGIVEGGIEKFPSVVMVISGGRGLTQGISIAYAFTERGDRCPLVCWHRLNRLGEYKFSVAQAKARII